MQENEDSFLEESFGIFFPNAIFRTETSNIGGIKIWRGNLIQFNP